MGLKILRQHNKSSLYKWSWRFNEHKTEVWKDVIAINHGRDDFCKPKTVLQTNQGAIWKNISKLWVWGEYQIGGGRR